MVKLTICLLMLAMGIGLLLGTSVHASVGENGDEASPSPTPSAEELEETKPLGTITAIKFSGVKTYSLDVVADVATLKVGDTLTREKLAHSIFDLRAWGIFESVEVLVEYDDDGIVLNYELVEGYLVKQVTIRGNYPLLLRKVQTALFINKGAIYHPEQLPEQIDRLDRLYEQEGYYGTTVLAVEDYDEENHQVSLLFRIKKGTTYRLRQVGVEGATATKEARIKNIIFTFRHFKPKSLKKDLQKISELYRKDGFVRARVRVGSETFDYDAKKVDLDVLIREGPHVKVQFDGNNHFLNKTLKKHITVFEDGDFDEFELDASKRKLIRFYQSKGYENVEVTWSRAKFKDPEQREAEKAAQRKVAVEEEKQVTEGDQEAVGSPAPEATPEVTAGPETQATPKRARYNKWLNASKNWQSGALKYPPQEKPAEATPSPQASPEVATQEEAQPETTVAETAPASTQPTETKQRKSPWYNKWIDEPQGWRAWAKQKPLPGEKIKKPKYYLVTFHIQEGPQRQVKAIDFYGNEQVKAKTLKNLIITKENSFGERGYYLQPLFEEDLRTIERYYQEEGYLGAEVKSWEKIYNEWGDRVTLHVDIDEGVRARVQELKLDGVSDAELAAIQPQLLLQPGKPYSPNYLSQDIQNLLVYLANNGYPYAVVGHDAVEVAPQKFDVTLKVDKGKEVRIGRLLFVGNIKTRETVIRKNLRVKEGDLFSTQKILQSQINLRALGIFDGVNLETLGLKSERKEVNLVVRLEERKPRVLDFEVGYSTDEGFIGKIIYNKLNMWGMGKNGNIKLQVGTQVNRLEVNYVDPRIFGKGVQLVVGAYGGREDRPFFLNTSVGAYANLFRSLTPTVNTFGRLGFEYADNNDSDTVFEKINPNANPNQSVRLTTTLGVTFDNRDNFGDPRRGAYLNSTVALTNEFVFRGGNYFTLRANLGYWYSPMRRFTIANALRVGQILAVPGDTLIPTDARFYAGGDNTVRGFEQDSLFPPGGNFLLIHNLEFQFRVFGRFMVVGFLDTGVDVPSISDVDLTTLRHSAGPGIRYLTPVGPIRLDYGFVLDPEPGDPTDQRLHFSFGYFF